MNSQSSVVPESRRISLPEIDRLELAIRRLLESQAGWRRRAAKAESRILELEEALRQVTDGRIDPMAMADEAADLREQNRRLREQLERAREIAARMSARLQFGEEER